MSHIAGRLRDRESVYRAAEGLVHCDVGELHRINTYVDGIPIHTIPHSLVSLTMILGSTVRQFKEKVELALRLHRQMDASMFQDFFQTMAAMNEGILATCRDIDAEVSQLEAT